MRCKVGNVKNIEYLHKRLRKNKNRRTTNKVLDGEEHTISQKKVLCRILGCLELQRGQVFLIKKEVEKA